jgi:hypothetical protein
MTRLGVALAEFVQPDTPTALRALDEWIAKAGRPDLCPIWVRGFQLDRALVRGIRERGIEVTLYVETGKLEPAEILSGKWDCQIGRVASRAGDGTAVRINQEGNGEALGHWQDWPADTQIDVFCHIVTAMRVEADIRSWYTPQGRMRNRIDELHAYYPGPDHVDIVGFDMYSDDEAARFPPDQWMRSVEWCRATGKPVWVGETGRRGLTRRAEWLRSIPDAGVDAAIVMDMLALRPDGGHDDWRWTAPMRRAFREMVSVESVDATEARQQEREQLFENAERWRAKGLFTDAEWGAICAAFFLDADPPPLSPEAIEHYRRIIAEREDRSGASVEANHTRADHEDNLP